MKKSHVNVVSNEQVSNDYSLKWSWSQINRYKMNVVSNEQVSNEQGLKWIGLNTHGTDQG